MLNPIIVAEPRPNYRLWIKFADGAEGEVSLKHLVGKGVFQAWEDEGEFQKVSVDPEAGTVAWPGGIDLAPGSLYEKVTGATHPTSNPAPQSR
jgi:hypothetical protein